MEYTIIVGVAMVTLLVLFGLSQVYYRQTVVTLATTQADQLARNIVDHAESVYYYGAPSRTTITANIPQGIESVAVGPQEIVFVVRTQSGGIVDVAYPSAVTLQGTIATSAGKHSILIEAREGYVWVNGT